MSHSFFITLHTREQQIAWAEADDIGGALQAVVTLWEENPGCYAAQLNYQGNFFAEIRDPSLVSDLLGIAA